MEWTIGLEYDTVANTDHDGACLRKHIALFRTL